MTKEEVLRETETEWQRLLDIAQGVSPQEQLLAGAVGHWSVRDLLLHVAAGDMELVKIVGTYQATGEKTDYGDDEAVDRLNDAQVEEKRGLSLAQMWDHLRESHHGLLQFLDGLPGDAFDPGSYTGDWIATDSGGHYRDHREDLERWRAAR